MVRSIAAVVAGFLFTFIGITAVTTVVHEKLPAKFPVAAMVTAPDALLIDLAVVAVFAIAGCALCARLAPKKPLQHALLLGAIAFTLGIPNTMANWGSAPPWYNVLNLLLVLPFAWAGGVLGSAGRSA